MFRQLWKHLFYILDSSDFTDFIVGHDESALGVGHDGVGLNAGGIASGVESEGVRGCTGEAVVETEFPKGDIV